MKKLLFCTHKVNRANIRRENRKGVEHIVLTSFTLPPNIVMNGILYPTEVRNKTHQTLNRTPVTIEHPEIDGIFVSANDGEVDFDFRIGAFNENSRITDDNRIALDKVINVQKALMTEKGRRTLDRIKEVETNEKARPIHTSVGVWLNIKEVELSVNELGQEYTEIATDMDFDHDAILLDSVGASTPDQGTGIGINKEQVKVNHFVVDELSFSEIGDRLQRALDAKFDGIEDAPHQWVRRDSIKSDTFVYENEDGKLFQSKYEIDENENVRIQDIKQEVRFKSEYEPVNTADKPTEENTMRDKVIEMLGQLGIKVNADISDDDLNTALEDALTANQKKEAKKPKEPEVNQDLVDTVKDQATQIESLQNKLQANTDKDTEKKVKSIKACAKYKDLSENAIKAIAANSAEDFEEMYTSSIPSYSIGPTNFETNKDVDDKMFQVNVAEAK